MVSVVAAACGPVAAAAATAPVCSFFASGKPEPEPEPEPELERVDDDALWRRSSSRDRSSGDRLGGQRRLRRLRGRRQDGVHRARGRESSSPQVLLVKLVTVR